MQKERTLSIIKPDAVAKHHIGDILSRFEKNGLTIKAMKMLTLTEDQASEFYAIHKDKPFFAEVVKFMTSGPVVVSTLEGDDAVAKHRKILGATNPQEAEKGTIRGDFAETIDANAAHGSDSLENAATEITFFFGKELVEATV